MKPGFTPSTDPVCRNEERDEWAGYFGAMTQGQADQNYNFMWPRDSPWAAVHTERERERERDIKRERDKCIK